MKRVRITAVRRTEYKDLMDMYENPIEHACEVTMGQEWISIDGQRPEGMCSEDVCPGTGPGWGEFLRRLDEEPL